MKYFKNTELARLYNVSEKSVRNWIQASQEGKLELQLYEVSGKLHVANTTKNSDLIEGLAKRGKKYKNSRAFKSIVPSEDFYKLYNAEQILDIIASIDIYREIPYQYNYFDGWATHWDLYIQKLLDEGTPNSATSTVELLNLNLKYIDNLLGQYDKVNIIDVGVGNAMPVRELIAHLNDNGKLNRYIGIDISPDMIAIAKKNIHGWFGDKVNFEGYVKDINYDRFNDLLTDDAFEDEVRTANLILFLGGTISNLRKPNHALSTIHDSMGKNDFLIFSKKLDTEKNRRYFDLTATSVQSEAFQAFPGKLTLDLLNIDEKLYTVEQEFNEKNRARQICISLNVALNLEFSMGNKTRTLDLNKGEQILVWRATHQDTLEIIEQLDENDYELLQATKSSDRGYFMSVSKIKTSD